VSARCASSSVVRTLVTSSGPGRKRMSHSFVTVVNDLDLLGQSILLAVVHVLWQCPECQSRCPRLPGSALRRHGSQGSPVVWGA